MNPTVILYPVISLVALTLGVLLLIPYHRFRAGILRQVVVDDFKFGESERVPATVRIPNRNYMNLLELPLLFYVVCLALLVTKTVTPGTLNLAWAYVALRVLHSLVHLTYNNVLHRLACFALSNFVLLTLWILFAVNLGQ